MAIFVTVTRQTLKVHISKTIEPVYSGTILVKNMSHIREISQIKGMVVLFSRVPPHIINGACQHSIIHLQILSVFIFVLELLVQKFI